MASKKLKKDFNFGDAEEDVLKDEGDMKEAGVDLGLDSESDDAVDEEDTGRVARQLANVKQKASLFVLLVQAALRES